jgi:hypothetical protein
LSNGFVTGHDLSHAEKVAVTKGFLQAAEKLDVGGESEGYGLSTKEFH